MELKLVLLADEENSVHPRNLPWKEEYEPWILFWKDNNYQLFHTDCFEGKKKSEFLMDLISRKILPDIQKDHTNYLRNHNFSDYKTIKQSIKQLLGNNQGSYLKIEFSSDLNEPVSISLGHLDNLDNIFKMVKKSYVE